MQAYNRSEFIGNLVSDPKLEELKNEERTKKVSLTLAVNRSNAKKLQEQGRQSVDYFKAEMFGPLAEVLSKVKKGDAVLLIGEMHIDRVDTLTSTGISTNYYTKLIINEFRLLDKREEV